MMIIIILRELFYGISFQNLHLVWLQRYIKLFYLVEGIRLGVSEKTRIMESINRRIPFRDLKHFQNIYMKMFDLSRWIS